MNASVGNETQLFGTSTYQRAGLTFVRGGVQVLGRATKGGLLRSDWLLHQETSEHRGSGFVEPLFEESINFFL